MKYGMHNMPQPLSPPPSPCAVSVDAHRFCWFIMLFIVFWPLCWLPFVLDS